MCIAKAFTDFLELREIPNFADPRSAQLDFIGFRRSDRNADFGMHEQTDLVELCTILFGIFQLYSRERDFRNGLE